MRYLYDVFNKSEYGAHRLVLDLIKNESRVLDIGCATGYFARELFRKNCETWGVDSDKEALKKASGYCKKTVVCNLDSGKNIKVPRKYFDYVIILDVIEHLTHPEIILSQVRAHLKKGGTLIVSTPNIAHASIRWMLARGKFDYAASGILDKTHVHFYTQSSFRTLLNNLGFKKLELIPTNGMCKVPFLYKISDRFPQSWQYWLVKKIPSLFSFQFIAVTKPTN